ncbi:hypothetical protein [Rugosimonospora africana]|uniref:Uncharacterized protein n=1 Tax=Rugosimonospora africana TaxID=556532 RepID=A0A8J3QZ14_9ACTN|nr:hypothetical protein [Rugosimonospora africana]GIH19894.1 hypothetical protein Raf01_80660 [Rugosimonospora africana]
MNSGSHESPAAARECLSGDASAVVDLLDAAQWWSVYRDADVTDRLRELLQAVPRRDLEQLARDRHGGLVPAVRTALLVLDGHGLTPPVDG